MTVVTEVVRMTSFSKDPDNRPTLRAAFHNSCNVLYSTTNYKKQRGVRIYNYWHVADEVWHITPDFFVVVFFKLSAHSDRFSVSVCKTFSSSLISNGHAPFVHEISGLLVTVWGTKDCIRFFFWEARPIKL